tara:strand:- start:236 stop:541 length:306 start_codon:yes stop_codon:yes gene_type:complete
MSSTFYRNVADWLRTTRDSQPKKVTQTKAAKHLNVTFQQIQKYERGINNIGLEKFYDLCKLYNIPDSLIGDLLKQFKETPNVEDVVASPKILQVIDGGKYE